MPTSPGRSPRREVSLTRDRIVDAAISLLDSDGEAGLTFRTLADRLSTGPGALYWHIANKTELLAAASDRVIAHTLDALSRRGTPETRLRTLALALFDTLDAHPWIGSVLLEPDIHAPVVRLLEALGQQVVAMGVPVADQWRTVSVLFSYIVGVSRQNSSNGQLARARGLSRDAHLANIATLWSELDRAQFPFVQSLAHRLRTHDDREDFRAGINLLLRAIRAPLRR